MFGLLWPYVNGERSDDMEGSVMDAVNAFETSRGLRLIPSERLWFEVVDDSKFLEMLLTLPELVLEVNEITY